MDHWHVLYTKPHSEFQVRRALTSRGIECYLPTFAVPKPRAGRRVVRAFFPCYLFARFDMKKVGESSIIYLPGLRYVVRFAEELAVVDAAVVERIAKRLAKPLPLDESGRFLVSGDAVEILEPGFEEIDAVFDARLSPEGRVRVFLRCVQEHQRAYQRVERLIPMELELEMVRKRGTGDGRRGTEDGGRGTEDGGRGQESDDK